MAERISQMVETYIFLCNPDFGFLNETGVDTDNRKLPAIVKPRLAQGAFFLLTGGVPTIRVFGLATRLIC